MAEKPVLKIIKSEEEYIQMMHYFSALMDISEDANNDEVNTDLLVYSTLIEHYEKERWPIDLSGVITDIPLKSAMCEHCPAKPFYVSNEITEEDCGRVINQWWQFSIEAAKYADHPRKVFIMNIRAKSYWGVREKARIVAQRLANGLHFYHVHYTLDTKIGDLPSEHIIQAPAYFGGEGYVSPEIGDNL